MLKLVAGEQGRPGALGVQDRRASPPDGRGLLAARLAGHPEIAVGLDCARALLDAEAVWLHRLTGAGMPGEPVAAANREEASGTMARLCTDDWGRITGPGKWLRRDEHAPSIYVLPLHAGGEQFALSVVSDVLDSADRDWQEGRILSLVPMVELAISQWAGAERERRERERHCALLETCGFSLVAVDETGCIHSATAAARQFLSQLPLSDRDGRLGIANVEDAVRFQLAVRRVLEEGGKVQLPAMVSIRRERSFPLLMAIRPLPALGPGPRLVLVQITDPLQQPLLPIEPLSAHFGLTGVERRLVEQLAIGRTIAEAASALKLKEQTARSYLKQVFQKTGICRQVELVGLLLKGAVPHPQSAR